MSWLSLMAMCVTLAAAPDDTLGAPGEPPIPEAPPPSPPPSVLDEDPLAPDDGGQQPAQDDDEELTGKQVNPQLGAAAVAGFTAGAGCLCGVLPSFLCTWPVAGACCVGVGSAGAMAAAAATGSAVVDLWAGIPIQPMRLGLAALFGGGVALIGAVFGTVVVLMAALVVGLPTYLVTQDPGPSAFAFNVTTLVVTALLLAAGTFITASAAAGGYYLGATLEHAGRARDARSRAPLAAQDEEQR